MAWFWCDEPWQYRVLDQLPSGIDQAQLTYALTLSPTQRVQSVMDLMTVAEDLQRAMRKSRAERP